MQLEVQLTANRRQVVRVCRRAIEEFDRVPDRYAQCMRGLDHLRGRPTSAITKAEEVQRPVGAGRVLEVAGARGDLLRADVAVVRISGRGTGEDPRPRQPLPTRGAVDR